MKRFFDIFKYFVLTYPVSLCCIALVFCASLVHLPKGTEVPAFPYWDKVVHVVMYFALSGMLWVEFLRSSKKRQAPLWHAWVGASLCPVLLGGLLELLQGWCTQARNASWLDFGANVLGVMLASIAGWYVYCFWFAKKKKP